MRFLCFCLAISAFACGPADDRNSSSDLSRSKSKSRNSESNAASSNIVSSATSQVVSHNQKNAEYPQNPELSVTPGSTCTNHDEIRYPERIKYCRRSVSTGKKNSVINLYDKRFGYEFDDMKRNSFKIDHFVPLCMGGSNDTNNLWPQHEDIYPLTDPVEARLCDMLASGKVKQAFAIQKMVWVKFHLTAAKGLLNDLLDVLKGKKTVAQIRATDSASTAIPGIDQDAEDGETVIDTSSSPGEESNFAENEAEDESKSPWW